MTDVNLSNEHCPAPQPGRVVRGTPGTGTKIPTVGISTHGLIAGGVTTCVHSSAPAEGPRARVAHARGPSFAEPSMPTC